MQPINELLDEAGVEAGRQDVIDAIVEENVERILGPDEEVVETEWRPEERQFIDRTTPFYESKTWINRLSTTKLCLAAPQDYDLGTAAYKSRKLIKASIVIDDNGRICDALYTGDFFMRPLQTATTTRVIDELSTSLIGLDPSDETALKQAVSGVLDDSRIEIPRVSATDFIQPVLKASSNRQPIEEYLATSGEAA
jgi:hypothetical protein